jgi:predicted O-linked N-acetylglucosamine transferase (SPINDLY family)
MQPIPTPPAELIQAVRRDPGDTNAWLTLGRWLATHVNPAAAVTQLEYGVSRSRDPAPILAYIAQALASTPAAPARVHALNRLAALRRDDPEVLAQLGAALAMTAAAPTALKPLRAAVALGDDRREVLALLASLELAQGLFDEARAHFDQLLERYPDDPGAWAAKYRIALSTWEWEEVRPLAERARLACAAGVGRDTVPMHILLSLFGNDPPALLPGQRRKPPPRPPGRRPARRLRVGYLSPDLRTHAVGMLMAGLFERHDRDRFEVFLYNYGPRNEDPYRTRLQHAADHWADLNDLDTVQAAQRIAADGIDVLIELAGHTAGSRTEITATRPAPVQIHYLGHAGSLSLPGIDYYLGDHETIPPEGEAEFAEHVLRLRRCFMVTDDRRALPRPITRSALGLPEDAIVLINYNQSWKWSVAYVDVWLRALARHERAVLWARTPSPDARRRLIERARAHGVARPDERIVAFDYADDMQSHLDRIALADLAVDQLPYSSHSIAAELLWAGVPLLTQRGVRFAGRVGASVVKAAGLPDFITGSTEDYERQLDTLLANPDRLLAARRHLTENRHSLELFDTQGFARDLEDLLLGLFEA